MHERPAPLALRRKPLIGFAASLLAVWCQVLLLGTLSLAPLQAAFDPTGDPPLCHADGGSQPNAPDQPAHDCVLCVVCVTHAVPVAILSPTPVFAPRVIVAAVRHPAARPRAPPLRPVAAAQPRGPPALT